jgi:hypothetical protein
MKKTTNLKPLNLNNLLQQMRHGIKLLITLSLIAVIHPYEEIKSFWVQTPSAENGMESLLFIDSGRYFMPIITMPTHTEDREAIRERLLSKGIEEKEMKTVLLTFIILQHINRKG